MDSPRIDKLLLVDDDADLVATLTAALAPTVGELETRNDTRSTLTLLERWVPELILLDLALPDGNAFDVLDYLHAHRPMPLVIAISGTASPDDSFRLAQRGVHTFLAKPFGLDELRAAIARVQREPMDIRPQVKAVVGRRGLHEVESEVRATMLGEAIARAEGSRRGAARLLDISRQLLQHMLRRRK